MTATTQAPDLMLAFRMALSDQEKARRQAFSERVRHHRDRQRLSQDDLADLIGVKTRAVQHWEGGDVMPSHSNMRKLSKALKVRPEDLDPEDYHPIESVQAFIERVDGRLGSIEARLEELALAFEKDIRGNVRAETAKTIRERKPAQRGKKRARLASQTPPADG